MPYRVLQQQDSEIVMIKLYSAVVQTIYGSIYPLLYYFFQIRNGLGGIESVAGMEWWNGHFNHFLMDGEKGSFRGQYIRMLAVLN